MPALLSTALLSQARALAQVDPRRPQQANLRRAISAAYYALFHLLTEACIRRVCPATPPPLAARMVRALSHGEMKEVCGNVARGNAMLLSLIPAVKFSPELSTVAQAFAQLQEARHEADYDTAARFYRVTTFSVLQIAEDAVAAWSQIETTGEGTVFLSALLFAKRWGR